MGDPSESAANLRSVCDLIRDVPVALLTTTEPDGRFHTRPVQTLRANPSGTLWFFTDWDSDKVSELQRDVRVSLGYANPSKRTYVAIAGTGRLLKDPDMAKQLWRPAQRAFYPDGPEDPRLALLRIQIERAEYWIAPGRVSYWAAALRAWITGRPAGVIGQNRRTGAC